MPGPENEDTGRKFENSEGPSKDLGETLSFSDELEPVWRDIISEKIHIEFDFLAGRILKGALSRAYKQDPSEKSLAKCARELRDLYLKNASRPSAGRDLKKILGGKISMIQSMLSPEQVGDKIARGQRLVLAGDEDLLRKLPKGDWIAGTIPCFMTEEGGQCNRENIHVTQLPDFIESIRICSYDERTISAVYSDAPDNGVSFIIIPAKSPVHSSFALNAPNFEQFAMRPLVGWVSGVLPEDAGSRSPKVFNGLHAEASETDAIVMHVALPEGKLADIGIINIFVQGDGDNIMFPKDGFQAKKAYINGKLRNFSEYLNEQKLDTRLPLVADYCGVSINTSIVETRVRQAEVEFYAPVFSGICYRHARPVVDYIDKFISQLPLGLEHQIVFSCNCMLNYLYSNLEGKRIPGITGPATLGEIAYLLLNQTMVYLRIIDLPHRR